MTAAAGIAPDDRLAVALGSGDPARLHAILRPEIGLAIWWRAPPVVPSAALAAFRSIRLEADVTEAHGAVLAALARQRRRAWHAPVAVDIALLGRRFAALMGIDRIEIRLEAVRGNACWKFHADDVTVRLITTYVGPGTEWMLRDTGPAGKVHQLAPGDIGLFKGRAWAPDMPVLHRSPPIEGSGDVRLLLVIDPAPAPREAG